MQLLGHLIVALAFAALVASMMWAFRRARYYRGLCVRLMIVAREVQVQARERADARIMEVEATADARAHQRILRAGK